MLRRSNHSRVFPALLVLGLIFLATGLLVKIQAVPAQATNQGAFMFNDPLAPVGGETAFALYPDSRGQPESPAAPGAACPGGPTIDGITLDECYVENFTVGGASKSITVWYTNVATSANRTLDDGSTVTLQHWINNDAEAQQVAAWGREAWERYYDVFGKHPYDTGCGGNINVRMEDGVGWSGIAYWASSGSCWIGIDSPTIRGGGGQATVYHEFQHYLQYAYDDGCYGFLKPNYKNGKAEGDAEFVEGYADLAKDAVDAGVDAIVYGNSVAGYNPLTSFYDKSYNDVFNKYFIEQLGSLYTPTDPHHHMDAVKAHYEECDLQDTLYVLDTLVPSLKPGMTKQKLFLNFFAANWAKDWADPTTQPELVYTDDDGNPYGSISLWKNVTISSGSQSWTGETTPDDWAARYYQVRPQSGCDFVTVDVDGAAGADLGINLMAADTSAPTSVQRSAWIGEDFARTFSGAGTHNRIAAVVNAFDYAANYDVSFTCVTPALDILEPRQTNFALVGDPTSPIAFLARFKVTSGGAPVLGISESQITAEAEGDAVTIVPGSFSQSGEEYWVILTPPAKPAGTTFVDLTICVDGSVCDTETDALLYVDPGNTDFGLVFDGSGSMATEDVLGEGTRLANAKKAGDVLANLLRVGDRILVTDFSAKNNPVGCGLPGGDGNCELDIITRLPRTDVTAPASNAIASAHTAINNITARDWTPIGAALQDAKNKLVAGPTNTNPKHIVLLSDGEENVNPLYADIKADLIASGVVVDTIGFSLDAPEPLLAQIAADTGGTYRYVPTISGTLAPEKVLQGREALLNMGVPPDFVNSVTVDALPGPLGLDDVYDYYETLSQQAQRLNHVVYTGVADSTYQYTSQYVDASVNTLRLVSAGKQGDNHNCGGYNRVVEVLPPTTDPRPIWIQISPPNKATPTNWDIRNSQFSDVVLIPNPMPGTWQMRTLYFFTGPCLQGQESAPQASQSPQQFESDFLMNMSAESNIKLQGRFLPPIVNNQGMAGDHVPIVATLLNRTGAIKGALVVAVIQGPSNDYGIILWDDGAHMDGNPGDGVYGNMFNQTSMGGTYNVRMGAFWQEEGSGEILRREWLGSFWINGPTANDQDQDGLPDDWERRCKLNLQANDAQQDPDKDGLTNYQELQRGTLPCDADTDDGGERDGSEVNGGRNPLYAPDDLVRPIGHISVAGLNGLIRIQWTHPLSYTNMLVDLSPSPDKPGQVIGMGRTGIYTATNVINDQPYYLRFWGMNGTAQGNFTDPFMVTPKEDPDPPSGAILVNDGAPTTHSRQVLLSLSSSDVPLEGAAESANAHLGGPLALKYNTITGNVEMRISNDPSFDGVSWEPLASEKDWVLENGYGTKVVYAQFRDGADNESFIVQDEITYEEPLTLFMPFLNGAP